MSQDFNKLKVYEKSYKFALEVYKLTSSFPVSEKYNIVSQLRRAASSIGANIAEGCGRKTKKELSHFMYISLGSLKECEHFISLSKDLDYLDKKKYEQMTDFVDELGKMIFSFIRTL